MQESEVFERVLESAESRDVDPLIHVPETHKDIYEGVVSGYDQHKITISGRYPDIIGYNSTDEIIAIEVKGSNNLLRGIGQALVYQQGSHKSYLASDHESIERIQDVAVPKGLGVIRVGESGSVDWQQPHFGNEKRLIGDIQTQLNYQLRGYETAGKIAGMSLSQPLNFLSPVLPLGDRKSMDRKSLEKEIEEKYGFSAVDSAIRGASILGILEGDNKVRITEQGELTVTTLAGYGVQTLDDLKRVKDDTKGSYIYRDHLPLAVCLRNLFLQHPEFRSFVDALRNVHDEKIRFDDLVEHMVEHHPNVFLNVFCSSRTRERARKYIENNIAETIYNNEDVWKDLVRNNILFNFLNHLKHMGIVSPKTSSHGSSIDGYDPKEKPWYLL